MNIFNNYYFKIGLIYNSPVIILLIFENSSMVSFSLYLCLALILLKREPLVINIYLLIGYMVFVAYILMSFSWGSINDYSIYKTIVLIAKFSALFLVFNQIKGENDITAFAASLLFLFPVIALLSYIKIFYIQEIDINNRLEVGAVNPIWLTRYLLESFLICAVIYRKKALSTIILISSLPIVLFSGSKGGLVALIVTLLVYYFSNQRMLFVRLVCILLIVTLIAFFMFATLPESMQYYLIQRFFQISPDGISSDLLIHSRGIMWPYVFNYMNENPLTYLFGVGIGNFGEIYGQYGGRLYPHNILIEFISELGVIGLVLLLLFVYKFLYLKGNNVAGAIALYYFINAQFSGDILLNERFFVFTILSYMYFHKTAAGIVPTNIASRAMLENNEIGLGGSNR